MKKKMVILPLLTGLVLILMTACPPSSETPEIMDISVDEITETSAKINWRVSNSAFSGVQILIYKDADPGGSGQSIPIAGNNTSELAVDGLSGLTKYRFTIALQNNLSEEIYKSEEKTFKTSCTVESIEMITEDNYTLKGQINYLSSRENKLPGIIMMHGLNEVMGSWHNSEIMEALIPQGYVCMAFYFRGHSNSQAWDGDFQSVEGIKALHDDTHAAIKFLKNHPRIDASSICLMGGSMGAMQATNENMHPDIKTSVALSPGNSLAEYKSIYPEYQSSRLSSIFYIVGENDVTSGGTDFCQATKDLHKMTQDPRKLWIVPGSKNHGSSLLTIPGINDSIADWLKVHLPSPGDG